VPTPTAASPAGPSASTAPGGYRFEAFTLDSKRRLLKRDGVAVDLPSRAFDTLLYLIGNRERCVGKEELIASIWHDVVVTDDSLIHAISVLRRALGDERRQPKFIRTVPRRGYRFVAEATPLDATASVADTASPEPRPTRRRRGGLGPRGWLAAGGVAAAVLIALFAPDFAPTTSPEDPPAGVRLFQPAPPDTSIVSGGVLSPDGRYLAFVARETDSGATALWVRSLQTSELRRIDGTEHATKPFWSPDSRQIGFFANGRLIAADLVQGSHRIITSVFTAAGGSWGLDDTILFAEWSSGLYAVPASGDGRIREVATLDREAADIAFAWPQFFPDDRRFIYQVVSLDPERSGIHVGDLDSERSERLLETSSPATLAPPRHLLHVRNDMLIAEELDLERLELTGRAIVVAREVSEPSLAAGNILSAATGLLAFRGGVVEQSLAWYDRDGTELGALTLPTALFNPRISPDGSRLLGSGSVTTDPGLWLVRLAREEYSRLETDAIGPIWSPDGRRVALTARGGFDLVVRSVEGPDDRRVLGSDDTVKILNDWSPDGRHIVFTRPDATTELDLWTIDADSGASRPLLATGHNETQARISPDGNWIAYASDESGTLETYVARFPSLQEPRRISTDGGGQPQWRADQRELYYLAGDRAVMAVEVAAAGGGAPAFGPPQLLFRATLAGDPGDARDFFAASADGSKFLIDSSVRENDSGAISLILNWAGGPNDREAAEPRLSLASD
jgi:Tol biopolymer transport system component/DNA-binding winged helix-turn-helix (wHTH) protein